MIFLNAIWMKNFHSNHYILFFTGNHRKVTLLPLSIKYEDKACCYDFENLYVIMPVHLLEINISCIIIFRAKYSTGMILRWYAIFLAFNKMFVFLLHFHEILILKIPLYMFLYFIEMNIYPSLKTTCGTFFSAAA